MSSGETGWAATGGGTRASWVSGRKDGRQVAVEDDEDNFEVDSAMLAPLQEFHADQKLAGGGRLRAAAKRRRAVYACLAGFVVSMVLYASAGGMASYKWATANNACEHLRFESTEGNSVHEWEKWADAVSKVYLRHKVLALPHVSSIKAAKECAGEGWSRECTQRVFQQNPRARAELHQIEQARNVLESEYSKSVAGKGLLPHNQEMRLPAGLGLELLLANSRAERGVCEMPPQDPACIAARREEEEAVKVLHAELHAAVSTVIDEQHGLVGNLLQPSAALRQHVALVRKLAALIHSQKAPDQLSQEGWRTLNAVSAVVLKQTLARVEADAATSFHDVLLHHDSPHILYIGAFKGLRFDGLGCLYRTDGSLAYSGGFRDGLMHGQGTLLDHQGAVLWKGHFYDGSPARPWYSL